MHKDKILQISIADITNAFPITASHSSSPKV